MSVVTLVFQKPSNLGFAQSATSRESPRLLDWTTKPAKFLLPLLLHGLERPYLSTAIPQLQRLGARACAVESEVTKQRPM